MYDIIARAISRNPQTKPAMAILFASDDSRFALSTSPTAMAFYIP